jgi:hypothetical protein
MPLREVVRGELRRDAAEAARDARAEHRQGRRRAPEQAQRVWQQACHREREQDDRDREILRAVAGVPRRRRQPGADDAKHDRGHRDVLVAPDVLVQHALREEQQHEQAGGQGRLHDDERREQQRDDLQRPADDRQARSEQPAPAAHEAPDERQAQVLAVGRLLGVHRLQRDP